MDLEQPQQQGSTTFMDESDNTFNGNGHNGNGHHQHNGNGSVKKRHHHHKKKLSESQRPENVQMYDVTGDGKLDEFEKQIMKMDPKHTGHINNQQVYNMLVEQKELHEQVFNMKRILCGIFIITLILACSNLATGWVAARLAKDTEVDSQGHLTSKDSGEVLKVDTNVQDFQVRLSEVQVPEVVTSEEDDSDGPPEDLFDERLRRRNQEIVTTTANTMTKAAAAQLYSKCPNGAALTRKTQSGEQSVTLCPADTTAKSGTQPTDATRYSYTKGRASLTVMCPDGNPADTSIMCTMTGSALASPIGAECREDADCASSGAYCFLNVCSISNGITYYVDLSRATNGDGKSPNSPFNTLDRRTVLKKIKAGDTLVLMGTITNPSYNPNYSYGGDITDPHLWHSENTLHIRLMNGEPGRPITITSYDDKTILKGDGNNIIRVQKSSYLRFTNLRVEGEVDRIPYSTAVAMQLVYKDSGGTIGYRVDPTLTPAQISEIKGLPKLTGATRPSYTDTRGFYADNSHHLVLEKSHIHHTPGNGVRFAYTEYVDMLDNEVNHCSIKSYSGTMGVTPTYIQDQMTNDPAGIYRLRVLRNKVHHNYNEIFSWAPSKTFIHPVIDEGKGISCERCNTFANGGRALFANNVVYWNGYSGLNTNDGHNIDFIGNTAWMNSYTDSVWALQQNGAKGTASRAGITFNEGTSNRMFNNIAVCDTDVKGYCLGAFREAEVEADSNLQFGLDGNGNISPVRLDKNKAYSYENVATNKLVGDPMFVDPFNFDFRLQRGSPAKGAAIPQWALLAPVDFFGEDRDPDTPDLGAIELIGA